MNRERRGAHMDGSTQVLREAYFPKNHPGGAHGWKYTQVLLGKPIFQNIENSISAKSMILHRSFFQSSKKELHIFLNSVRDGGKLPNLYCNPQGSVEI